jgi:hypothetical protein
MLKDPAEIDGATDGAKEEAVSTATDPNPDPTELPMDDSNSILAPFPF